MGSFFRELAREGDAFIDGVNRREACRTELTRLCKEEGIGIDDAKLRKVLDKYGTDDIARVIDAMYRFGVKNIIASV